LFFYYVVLLTSINVNLIDFETQQRRGVWDEIIPHILYFAGSWSGCLYNITAVI
jgi:hypothetical protein